MMLSVIIVSFNTKGLLKKCLESIARARRREDEKEEWEIIIVDNGSTDGSAEQISSFAEASKDKKNVKFKAIFNKENLGFARANNQGIKEATGEYLLLLNSDTEIKPGALEKLVEFAKDHPEAGVIGARLLSPDGSIQPSVYYFPNFKRVFGEIFLKHNSYFEKYFVQGSQPTEVEAVVFAAVLIPKKTIENVGLLDERYFMYFEDLDYCRRIKRAGFRVYYLPEAEVVHYHGASAKGRDQIYDYSAESSKIYHGKIKFWVMKIVLRGIHKWQRIFGRS